MFLLAWRTRNQYRPTRYLWVAPILPEDTVIGKYSAARSRHGASTAAETNFLYNPISQTNPISIERRCAFPLWVKPTPARQHFCGLCLQVLFLQLAGRKGVAASFLRGWGLPFDYFGKQNQLRLFPNFTPRTPPIANTSRSSLCLKPTLLCHRCFVPASLQNNAGQHHKQNRLRQPPLLSTQPDTCFFWPVSRTGNETDFASKPQLCRPPASLNATRRLPLSAHILPDSETNFAPKPRLCRPPASLNATTRLPLFAPILAEQRNQLCLETTTLPDCCFLKPQKVCCTKVSPRNRPANRRKFHGFQPHRAQTLLNNWILLPICRKASLFCEDLCLPTCRLPRKVCA